MQPCLKILLVEDDRQISIALGHALRTSYEVETAPQGKRAIYKADRGCYDIIVLDLNLPDMHGLAVCQQLRERGCQAPILILSGDVRIMSKIRLLDAGGDDYLTKPFSVGELKARLRAIGRQLESAKPKTQLHAAGLSLCRNSQTVLRDGRPINLRRKEFALLECLLEQAGNVVSRETLTRSVWRHHEAIWTNTLEVHIKYLRDKVDKPFATPLIQTVYGKGYRLGSDVTLVR